MSTSCAGANEAALLLFHTPSGSGLEANPAYSLCTVRPNNEPESGRTAFSWGWSFAALPPSFTATGFYALLPPFNLTLPSGMYDIRLTKALSPTALYPMSIRLLLLPDDGGSPIVEVTETVMGFYIPTSSNISRGAIEFYVPPGMEGQSAAVDTVRYEAPVAPPRPPSPPQTPSPPLEQFCRPASSPYPVKLSALAFASISMPYTSYTRNLSAEVADPTALSGGCAFAFAPTSAGGDVISRHSLFFSSAPSPYAAALAWLPGSDPSAGTVLLSPGTTASLPATPAGGLDVMLSGDGRSSPLVVDYMAELASCAATNSVPVHLTPNNPKFGDMTLSICSAIPNVFTQPDSDHDQLLLDFSFGWNVSALPAVFSDRAGFTAELRNYTLPTGARLPSGWYGITFLRHSSVALSFSAGNASISNDSAFYISEEPSSISIAVRIPFSSIPAMSAAVQVASLPSPPPLPPSPVPPSPAPPRPEPPSPGPSTPSPPSPEPSTPPPPSPEPSTPASSPSSPAPPSPAPSMPSPHSLAPSSTPPPSPKPSTPAPPSPEPFTPALSPPSPAPPSPAPPSPAPSTPSPNSPAPSSTPPPPGPAPSTPSPPGPVPSPSLPPSPEPAVMPLAVYPPSIYPLVEGRPFAASPPVGPVYGSTPSSINVYHPISPAPPSPAPPSPASPSPALPSPASPSPAPPSPAPPSPAPPSPRAPNPTPPSPLPSSPAHPSPLPPSSLPGVNVPTGGSRPPPSSLDSHPPAATSNPSPAPPPASGNSQSSGGPAPLSGSASRNGGGNAVAMLTSAVLGVLCLLLLTTA